MTWTPNDPLTAEQLEYIWNFGGRFAVTSHRTNVTMRFSIVPMKSGTGMAVNLIETEGSKYVGYIGPAGQFAHTKASSFTTENVVFRTFYWIWQNRSSLATNQTTTVKGT